MMLLLYDIITILGIDLRRLISLGTKISVHRACFSRVSDSVQRMCFFNVVHCVMLSSVFCCQFCILVSSKTAFSMPSIYSAKLKLQLTWQPYIYIACE